MSGFLVIDKETNDIQDLYFDEVLRVKVRGSLIAMLRYTYGDHLVLLNGLDEIGEERTILFYYNYRDNYVSIKIRNTLYLF